MSKGRGRGYREGNEGEGRDKRKGGERKWGRKIGEGNERT